MTWVVWKNDGKNCVKNSLEEKYLYWKKFCSKKTRLVFLNQNFLIQIDDFGVKKIVLEFVFKNFVLEMMRPLICEERRDFDPFIRSFLLCVYFPGL